MRRPHHAILKPNSSGRHPGNRPARPGGRG